MLISYRRFGTTYRSHRQGYRSRNVGKKLPLLAASQPRRGQFSSTSRRKSEIMQTRAEFTVRSGATHSHCANVQISVRSEVTYPHCANTCGIHSQIWDDIPSLRKHVQNSQSDLGRHTITAQTCAEFTVRSGATHPHCIQHH